MKLTFLISFFVLSTTYGWAQDLAKPTMGQMEDSSSLPPGTIKVEVSLLSASRNDSSCQQEMKQISVRVSKVVALGSGLINPLNEGDSVNVRIMKVMDFSEDSLDETDTLLLKEQLCSFEKTYFTLMRKE